MICRRPAIEDHRAVPRGWGRRASVDHQISGQIRIYRHSAKINSGQTLDDTLLYCLRQHVCYGTACALLRSSSAHIMTIVQGVPGAQAGDISWVGRLAPLMAMVPP